MAEGAGNRQQSPDVAGPNPVRRSQPQLPAFHLPLRVTLMIDCAWLVLLVERIVAVLTPAAGVILLFLAAAWLDLPRQLPPWGHVALLAVFAAGFLYALYRGGRHFAWPDRPGALRRLEHDSGLDHRPLTHIDDTRVGDQGDPATASLWQRHRQRLLAAIGRLDLAWPDTGLARRDPLALRHGVLLLAFIGLVLAGDGWFRRIDQALLPDFAGTGAGAEIVIEAWITPPDYTGLPPISLSHGQQSQTAAASDAPLPVPAGSRLLIQAQGLPTSGLSGPASLQANDTTVAFDVLDASTQRAEAVLSAGDRIGVGSGFGTVAEWAVRLVPDLAPDPEFTAAPGVTERGVLRLSYAARDDYGVTDLRLVVSRGAESIEFKLPLSQVADAPDGGRVARGAAYQDLTAHPWAGLDVELRLVARDALEQIGASAPLAMTLPERKFFHPVARAIVEERKRLAADWREHRSVARTLMNLKGQPETYDENIAAFMGMDVAARHLARQQFAPSQLPPVLQLMWDTALDIEDGGTSIALQEFRRLQQELMEALERGASDQEIERLMNQVQEAMNRYMQDMMRQLERAMENGIPLQRLSPNGLQLSQRDLNQMLNDARRMAQSGAKDSAQQMLEQLQRLMENLQAGAPMMMSPESRQAQQLANDLARLMQRQQELLQQSFDAQRGQQPGQQDGMGEGEMGRMPGEGRGGGSGSGALGQEQLRRDLGDLMRQFGNMFGDLPQGMGAAEQAMRRAVEALNKPDFGGASDAQNEALNQLQQGLQAAQQMLQRQMGAQPGPGRREQMDPLGRAVTRQEDDSAGGNTTDGFGVDLPEAGALERARQIFEELRNRRNDPSRPKPERDYLDRLLKQF